MHQSSTPSLSHTIWYLTKMGIKTVSNLLIVQTWLLVTVAYSLSSEAVVMRQLRRWKSLWRRSLTRSHKRTSMGPSRSCWNGTASALQPEEITSKGTRVSRVDYQKSSHTKIVWKLIICTSYIYIYIYQGGTLVLEFNSFLMAVSDTEYFYIKPCFPIKINVKSINPFLDLKWLLI